MSSYSFANSVMVYLQRTMQMMMLMMIMLMMMMMMMMMMILSRASQRISIESTSLLLMRVIQAAAVVPIVFDDLYHLLSLSRAELCSYSNNSVRLVSAFMRLLLSQVTVHSSPIITIDNTTQQSRNPNLFQLNTNTTTSSTSSMSALHRVNLRQYVTDWVLYTVLPILRVHVETVEEVMLAVHDLLCIVQAQIIDSGCRYEVGR